MPTADLGPNGRRVAANVKAARNRIPLRELEKLLADLGRPILASGIHKIESGNRRVDVDDLVALALALGRTPNALILPPLLDKNGVELHELVELTPARSMPAGMVWRWANGLVPLRSDRAVIEPSPLTTDEMVAFADALRPIGEALVAAREAGVPAGKIYSWMEAFLILQVTGHVTRTPADESEGEVPDDAG